MLEQGFQSLKNIIEKQRLESSLSLVSRKMKAVVHDTEYRITEREGAGVRMSHRKIGTVRKLILQSDTVSGAPARSTQPTGTQAWNAQSDGPA
jgi:hypothetical protein